jgi:uncharacterized membrane protein
MQAGRTVASFFVSWVLVPLFFALKHARVYYGGSLAASISTEAGDLTTGTSPTWGSRSV